MYFINTYHWSVSIKNSFVTRTTAIRSNCVVWSTTPSNTICMARQTYTGFDCAGTIFVHWTLRYTVHAIAEIATFCTVFGTGSVTATVTFWMTCCASLVSSFVKSVNKITTVKTIVYTLSINASTYPGEWLQFGRHWLSYWKFLQDKHWCGPGPQHPCFEHSGSHISLSETIKTQY